MSLHKCDRILFIFCFVFIDDPYYCGLRARIPNFVKKKKKSDGSKTKGPMGPPTTAMMNMGLGGPGKTQPNPAMSSAPPHHPFWWHSRLYTDNSGQYSKTFFFFGSYICCAVSYRKIRLNYYNG